MEANYFTILQWFLPYIDMNQPWIYMCSPSRSPLPPPSPSHPSGSSQCTSPEHLSHASNLDWLSVSHLIVYLFQCCSLRSSHPRLLRKINTNTVYWHIYMEFRKMVTITLLQDTKRDTDVLSFLVAIPGYIPINIIGGLLFLHTLSSICYLLTI